jgi:enoyl-CoA hydratase/carnithine racemase
LDDPAKGVALSREWSRTARRLYAEFRTSVGFVNGKRCLGGFLELLQHCHYLVAVETADLGMPEVTLPVVPGMEGCHWIFRKTPSASWPKIMSFLLEGRSVKAAAAVGWLIDHSGTMTDCIKTCWSIARGDSGIARRTVSEKPLAEIPNAPAGLSPAASPNMEAGRQAILETIRDCCRASLAEAIDIQAKHSGAFMSSPSCRAGAIGSAFAKTAAA